MNSTSHEDEEERLRQKLKRKAEERKSIGKIQNVTENESSSLISDPLQKNNASGSSRDSSNRIDRKKESSSKHAVRAVDDYHVPPAKRFREEPNRGAADMYQRNRPHQDMPRGDRRRWGGDNPGPRDFYNGPPPMRGPHPHPPPYYDYRREDGPPPPFHQGERYWEGDRPFRDHFPRGPYPHEPFQRERDGYRRGPSPTGPPPFQNRWREEERRGGPAARGAMEHFPSSSRNSPRRPSTSSSYSEADLPSSSKQRRSRSRSSSTSVTSTSSDNHSDLSDKSRSYSSSSSVSSEHKSEDRSKSTERNKDRHRSTQDRRIRQKENESESDRDSTPSSDKKRKDHHDTSTRRSRTVDVGTGPSRIRSSRHHPSKNTKEDAEEVENEIPKDKRTIFVSQLIMRVNERDLYNFFRAECGCKVVDVILLRDKRTGRHKGCAFIEFARLQDIPRAMEWNDKVPSFQRFPIAVKPPDLSFLGSDTSAATVEALTEAAMNPSLTNVSSNNSLNVYVGNIDTNVTQPQLQAIFSGFGDLERVSLQFDIATGISKGFAFFGFRDARVANLCIQVMSGQQIAKKSLRTGWANTKTTSVVMSTEFPPDAADRIRTVDEALIRLNGSGLYPIYGFDWTKLPPSPVYIEPGKVLSTKEISSAAEAAINAALGVSNNYAKDVVPPVSSLLDPTVVGNNDDPTPCILVHNMFDKDQETEEGWEDDIELEFADECSKYGKVLNVKIMSKDVGGKIYALFETIDGAAACAKCFAGRWFDRRQLRVEFVSVDTFPR